MNAGLIRRAAALWIDVVVAVVPLALIYAVVASIVPLDDHLSLVFAILWPGAVASLGYVFAGPAFLENTFGRYVLGVRVRDMTGARPSAVQAITRGVTMAVWPIEAAVIAFRQDKRRFGDRLADTRVEAYHPSRSTAARCGLGLAVLVFACLVLIGGAPLEIGRMSISRVAQEYVAAQEGVHLGVPRNVQVVNDSGTVTFKVDNQRGLQLRLKRVRGSWVVQQTVEVPPREVGWWSYSVSESK